MCVCVKCACVCVCALRNEARSVNQALNIKIQIPITKIVLSPFREVYISVMRLFFETKEQKQNA